MIVALSALVLFAMLACIVWVRNYKYWERRNVPAVPARFPFGSFWGAFTLVEPIFQIVADAYDRFDAPMVGMYGPTQPVLLIRDPDLAKQVLVDNFNDFADPGFEVYRSVDHLLGFNPFGSSVPRWKEVRSIHTPTFTNSKVKASMQEIISSAHKLVDYIHKQKTGVTNVLHLTKMYLIDAVAKSGYGIDLKVWEDPDPLIRHIITQGVVTGSFESNVSSVCSILLPWANLLTRFKLLSKESDSLMKRIFEGVVPLRRKTVRNDAVQHLVEMEEKLLTRDNKGFSSSEWVAHLMVFFFDGTETSGIALSFIIFLLSQQPEIRTKLRSDLANKGIALDNLDFARIRSLDYLEMVLQECLRKLPPLPLLTRKTTRDTSLGGIRVPKGMKIIVPAMKLQNDPKHHDNPEGFDPERFSDKRKSQLRKGTHFPFGDGPRICLGMNYAKTAIKAALIALLLEFDWSAGPSHGETLEMDKTSTLFLFPKNALLEVKFTPI